MRFSTGSHYASAPSVEDIPGHSICAAAGALNADRKWRNVYGHAGETLALPHSVIASRPRGYNHRGRAKHHIKLGKNAVTWTRLSCHYFLANTVRLQLHALAYGWWVSR